ncbi:MAG: hypothetical protein V9F04_02600 [Dermatophilaceae bacterium]
MTQAAYDSSYGSVADEAARLIGLFSGVPDPEARAAGERIAARGLDFSGRQRGRHDDGSPGDGAPGDATHVCPECGHDSATSTNAESEGMPSSCRSCPVCMLITAARSVSPDTIERLADVVDLISDGLRGFAESRRSASPPPR